MKRALAVTALLAAVAAPSVALGWAHNGLTWPEDRFPLPIHLKPAPPEDTDLETIETIVQEALSAWNAVSCSYAVLEYAGIDDLPIQNDDDQVFAWSQDADSWVYGSSSAGATIIDVTAGYPRVDILFNDIYFDWVVGANTVVTAGYEFGVDPPIDVDPASVITHEVGHLLGLAHPNPQVEGSQPDALATMVFALLPNAQQSSLAADDKLGLCARYPAFPGDECGDGFDCGEDHECELLTAVDRNSGEELGSAWLCDEVRGTYGDFCSVDAWICAGTCLPTRSDYSEGYCTDTCEAVEDCPSDPFQWDCREFPIVGGDPIFLCVAEEAVGEDTGIGIVDAGPSVPDAGGADTGETDAGDDTTADVAADVGADAPDDDGSAGSGGGSDGCASSGRAPRGNGLAWLALAAILARRRR